jgi:tetratricopeptide (TPR) repeat protein
MRAKEIADYNEAIRLDPKSALAFGNRGIAYGKKGDNDRALADFDEAIRLNPNSRMAHRCVSSRYSSARLRVTACLASVCNRLR